MDSAEARRAVAAAVAIAAELDLAAEDAVVLSDSNRLVVRLLPSDTVARVTPLTHFVGVADEVELVRQMAPTGSPVAGLDTRVEPRVYVRDDFQITLWAHVAPVRPGVLRPVQYAQALARLHAGLRRIDLTAPHVADRVAATGRDVASRDVTPELTDADRALLADRLDGLGRSIGDRRAGDQLLHGEPHPANILVAQSGPLFIDFENAARGPIEYDLAWVPGDVVAHYPDADPELLDQCRGLVLAIVATHRWNRHDQHPSGRASGVAFLRALRDGPPWPALDEVSW